MLRKSHTYFLLLLFSIGVFSRCEEPVDLGVVVQDDILFVNSVLNPEAPAEVHVGTANSIVTTDEAYYIKDATVEIYGAGEDPEAVLIYQEGTNGIYRADEFSPLAGRTYEVKVFTDEYGFAFADSYVPLPSQVTNMDFSNIVISDSDNERTYSFDLNIQYEDASQEVNYYHLRLFQGIKEYLISDSGDTVLLEQTIHMMEFPAPSGSEYRLAGYNNGIIFTEGLLPTDHKFSLSTSIDPSKEILGELFTELRTVSKDYFDQQISIANSSVNYNGGLTQPGSGYGNVKNGAGAVTGYSGSLDTVVIN